MKTEKPVFSIENPIIVSLHSVDDIILISLNNESS